MGEVPQGWFHDVALALQRGISAEGRFEEIPGFQAPESGRFMRVRRACGFTAERYYAGIGLQMGEEEPSLKHVPSSAASGKSSAFFFFGPDQQFVAKSCTKKEWDTLLGILPSYVDHLEAAQRASIGNLSPTSVRGLSGSLLPRFLGLYAFFVGAKFVRVVVMTNVFAGACEIHTKYDLKGSTYGRRASQKERKKRSPVFKDLDWMERESPLQLATPECDMILEALTMDVDFLASQGLIDYSLLVGVHEHRDIGWGSIPYEAMNVVTVRDDTRYCYLGIVDVLTHHSKRKMMETYFTGRLLRRDISCQPPSFYARRFLNFVQNKVLEACK